MKIDSNIDKLTKNPLGIIALFILLNYGIASLVFGFVNNNITEYQRWTFIVFIVLFPFIILLIFYRLVTKYHTHLYSPSEYKDEANFLGMANKEFERKIEIEEMAELEREVNIGGIEGHEIKAEIEEMKNISNIKYNSKDEYNNIMNRYEKAEKLVLDKLAKEYNAKIHREPACRDSGFDGMLEYDNNIIYVEVKYRKRNFIPFTILENINYRAKNIIITNNNIIKTNKNIKFLLVCVIDYNCNIEPIQEKLNNYIKELPNNYLEVLVYRMSDIE